MVKGVQKVNDYEVIIETDGPFTPLKTHLSHIAAPLIDPAEADKLGTEYGMKPSGTGPFKFVSWQRNNQFVVEKNPNYFQQGKPYLDKITYRIIPDANARMLALEKGEVDVALTIPPQEVKRLRNDPNIDLREVNITRSVYLAMNYKREPFNDPKIRQAINYAVDKDAIVVALQEGTVAPATIPYPKHVPGSAEGQVRAYDFDPARAKQMLDETGWMPGSDGIRQKGGQKLTFKLSYPQGTIPNGKETAEAIQQNLQAVGVGMTIEALDAPAHFSAMQGRELEGYLAAIAAVNGDLHYVFTNQWTCKGIWNGGNYCNEQVDKLGGRGPAAAGRQGPFRQVPRGAEDPGRGLGDGLTVPHAVVRRRAKVREGLADQPDRAHPGDQHLARRGGAEALRSRWGRGATGAPPPNRGEVGWARTSCVACS